jgi:hypothetical protein
LATSTGGTRHCFQVSEARSITEARWCRHSGRDGRHERKIVRQFDQVGNRQGESDIAVKRDVLLLAAAHLCNIAAMEADLGFDTPSLTAQGGQRLLP